MDLKALVKLTADVHKHREKITPLYGKESYQEVTKEFIERYIEIKADKGAHRGWRSGYTNQEKSTAAKELLEAIKPDGTFASLSKETKELLLKSDRFSKITKPVIEELEARVVKGPGSPGRSAG